MASSDVPQDALEFFLKHKIPLDITIDARGSAMTKTLSNEMTSQDKSFAYNTAPCKNGGHTIKTRSKHCAECNTQVISHMLRSIIEGYIYIAGSKKGNLIKIGSTVDIEIRAKSLIKQRYANMSDWVILWSGKINKAGSFESKIQSHLKKHIYPSNYVHSGLLQEAKEAFSCSYEKAKQAVNETLTLHNIVPLNQKERVTEIIHYNFKNLIK